MRLICPNCGAQYEVADDVITASGRDVQCSNCGHTWFEEPGASLMLEAEAPPPAPMDPRTVRPRSAPKPIARPAAVPARDLPPVGSAPAPPEADQSAPTTTDARPDLADLEAAPDDTDDEPATFADVPVASPGPPGGLRMPKRTISAQIADILRQEAAREEAARRAEAQSGLEMQGELALRDTSHEDRSKADAALQEMLRRNAQDEKTAAAANSAPVVDPTTAAVASFVAASAMEPPEPVSSLPQPAPVAAPAAPHRRDLLPDIEEINSTLRSAADRGPTAAAAQSTAETASRSRGFRYGFSLILLIAAALAMVYIYTPRIVVAVPAAAPILEPYAEAVDSGRLWLDLELQDLLKMIAPDEATPAGE
jgi:predicted Zn finger-like uncharacterized protein